MYTCIYIVIIVKSIYHEQMLINHEQILKIKYTPSYMCLRAPDILYYFLKIFSLINHDFSINILKCLSMYIFLYCYV